MNLPMIDISALPDLNTLTGVFASLANPIRAIESDDSVIEIMTFVHEVIGGGEQLRRFRMIVRPELRALRGDDAPQSMAQTAFGAVFEQWRRGPMGCLIEAELGRFCEGQLLEDLQLLATLFAPGEPGVTPKGGRIWPTAALLVGHYGWAWLPSRASRWAKFGSGPMLHPKGNWV